MVGARGKEMKTPEWKKRLAESTGQWAFVLTLSRRMIWMLQIVRDCEYSGVVNATSSLATLRCLQNRGLVIFELKLGTPYGGKWSLTPAGESAVQLCEYAGVMSKERLQKVG
jgi:hypothetical protein